MAKYKRILLKLSGERPEWGKTIRHRRKKTGGICRTNKENPRTGSTNRHRYRRRKYLPWTKRSQQGLRSRVKGDQMGMLATVINSLALSSALVAAGVKARVLTAVRMEPIGEFYSKWKAIECMENGEIVIMSGGTGNPFFTTDTGSSLRGIEIEADVMLKGTRVDGIYTARPGERPYAYKIQ